MKRGETGRKTGRFTRRMTGRKTGRRTGRKCLMACLLVMSLALSSFVSMAGEQLGETDFDDGKGLPWHIVESNTGKMEFYIDGGKYNITIVDPGGASRGGEDRWDCQFRHRGLAITAGHQYRVKYEITTSNAGQYYTKIGNLEGTVEIWHNMSNGYDLDGTWDPIRIGAGETKQVDLTFTAGQSMEVAEWAFHLGGDGQYTQGGCFPAGTEITFDNMSLVDMTSDEHDYIPEETWQRAGILTNQVGYLTGAVKKATLLSDEEEELSFSLLDENGNEVFSGTSKPMGKDVDSGDHVHVLDFTELDEPGAYTIHAENGAESRSISVGNSDSYSHLLYDALNYFYQNRSGIAVESGYITSGDKTALSRRPGHDPDRAEIRQDWTGTGTSGSQDVTGGWYDAGDHGKYVVNGGISLWLLQNQYETAKLAGTEAAYADGTMSIPENGNGYPDLLDEARWEMEWMLTMLVQSGAEKDMAYHKVHDVKWTGLGMAPSEDTENRVLLPPTTAATLNVAACAAQAARLWRGIDDSFADTCLDAARRTYEAAVANPELYAPLVSPGGGGAYGDNDVTDEFYWAASELYITTGEDRYHQDMLDSKWSLSVPVSMDGGEAAGTAGCFDWGHTAALGTLSIAENRDAVEAEEYEKALDSICSAADHFLEIQEEQGYGQPLQQSQISSEDSNWGYVWGSNSVAADNSLVMATGYLLTGERKYYDGAILGMDYLLGRNPMDISYVTGYGDHTARYPHHRFWANLIDTKYPLAPDGVLVGGPNSGMEDPWVRGSGWKRGEIPAAKCYMDHIEAWSVNECTINWNAPLAWLAGFLAEYTEEGIVIGSTGEKKAPSSGEEKQGNREPSGQTEKESKEVPEKVTEKEKTGNTAKAVTGNTGNERKKDGSGEDSADPGEKATGTQEKQTGTNWALIIGISLGFLLLLAIAIMIFVYKMTKLKMTQREDKKILPPDQTEKGRTP